MSVCFFFFSFRFFCLFSFFCLKEKKRAHDFLRVAYLNPHMSGSWWMCERIRPHSAQCAPNPGTKQNGQKKKRVLYLPKYEGGGARGRQSCSCVCVCVCRGEGVRIFCFLSDYFFSGEGGWMDGWMDVDGCHVAYRCRVAVCCVVLCRKEGGGYDGMYREN